MFTVIVTGSRYYTDWEMAQAGADLCLAFPLGESRGTWNCVNECKKAGIPVKVIK